MGDGQELVPGVVGALVRLARGATGATGGSGQAVAEVVRARLRLMPEGARALAAVEGGPDDPRAHAALTSAVGQLLATDRGFAQYLATTVLGTPTDPSTVQLRTNPEADPRTVQLRTGPEADPRTVHLRTDPEADPRTVQLRTGPESGPSTVQLRVDPAAAGAQALAARRGNVAIIVALALVLIAALVALGINLGSRPLLRPTGPDFAHAARTIRDPAQVRGVLPDVAAMPGGWQVESGPRSGADSGPDAPRLLPDACDQQLAYATVTFRAVPVQTVRFTVVTFASAEAAGRAFGSSLDPADGEGAAATVTIPSIGDQSAARTHGSSQAEAVVRVGSTLLSVQDDGPGAAATTPALVLFARLLAERARQAEDGHAPDAVFHSGV
ncbi:hypothetical protein [Streptomyces sp. CBMA123]|uniref:hypothetical protein n=1 Tax=Streptomyces sp. CBMA123 TaxID=1896313 RepID=UPI001661DDB3|nr:hypothetical protein [Streptomyces sp. CBMA123]MBD0689121.1 hypothetical protein [Streptomyces sp. CBMA123]